MWTYFNHYATRDGMTCNYDQVILLVTLVHWFFLHGHSMVLSCENDCALCKWNGWSTWAPYKFRWKYNYCSIEFSLTGEKKWINIYTRLQIDSLILTRKLYISGVFEAHSDNNMSTKLSFNKQNYRCIRHMSILIQYEERKNIRQKTLFYFFYIFQDARK